MQTATFCGRRGVPFHCAVPGRVPGWRLVVDKPPMFPIGEASANIMRDATGEVMGVLYKIDAAEVRHIELTEGVPLGNYCRVELAAERLDGPGRAGVRAVSLSSEARDPTLLPSKRYMSLLIDGAIEHGLPHAYVEFLRSMPTQAESPAAALWWSIMDEVFRRLRCGESKR